MAGAGEVTTPGDFEIWFVLDTPVTKILEINVTEILLNLMILLVLMALLIIITMIIFMVGLIILLIKTGTLRSTTDKEKL